MSQETETGLEQLCERWRMTVGFSEPLNSLPADRSYRPPEQNVGTDPPVSEGGVGFQKLELVGQGGAGEVFSAIQTDLQRRVAVKQLRWGDGQRGNFVIEAVTTGQLEHPNILPVHALVHDREGRPSLLMKLVEGESWQTRLERARGDLEAQLEILIQVCNAVAYAHNCGIVHNDLKPANVMLGPFGEVQLLDWGLAVDVRGTAEGAARLRRPESITVPCGTPCYSPPELARGEGHKIGPWTDVYLLGGILYHILTGAPPHGGASLQEALLRRCDGRGLSFEDMPAELGRLCKQALAVACDARPDTAAFQQDVRAYLRHRQSLQISAAAHTLLDETAQARERHQLYGLCGEAVAGFRQALELWQDNQAAKQGERAARLRYAQAAQAFGDLGLAESQARALPALDAEPILTAVAAARRVEARERRTRLRLRRGLVGAVALLVVGLIAGLLVVQSHNRELRLRASLERSAQRLRELEDALCLFRDDAGLAALRDDVDTAIAQIDSLITDNPAENALWMLKGKALSLVHRRQQADAALTRGLQAEDSGWTQQVALRPRAQFWRASLGLDQLLAAALNFSRGDRKQALEDQRAAVLPRIEADLEGAALAEDLRELVACWQLWLRDGPAAALPRADALTARGGPSAEPFALALLCALLSNTDTGERVAQTLDRNANLPVVWLARCMIARTSGELAISDESLRRARQLDPDSRPLRQIEILLLIDDGKLEQASQMLEEEKDDPAFYLANLSDIVFRRGDPGLALQHAQKALELDPEYEGVWYACGLYSWTLGDTAAAFTALDRALELKPNLLNALQLRGQLYHRTGRPDACYADAATLLEIAPKTPFGWELMGQLQYDAGAYSESLESFEKALSYNALRVSALFGRARSHLELGNHGAAEQDLNQLLDLDPDRLEAREIRAWLRMQRKDTLGTLEDLTLLLEVTPRFDLLQERMELYEELKEWQAALADVERMLDLPKGQELRFYLLFNRGKYLHKLGEIGLALASMREALPLAPNQDNRATVERAIGILESLE